MRKVGMDWGKVNDLNSQFGGVFGALPNRDTTLSRLFAHSTSRQL